VLFGFYAVDPKCSSYQAEDLICFSGDCHVVVCPVEVTFLFGHLWSSAYEIHLDT